ncbi:hypothetical protein Dip518_001428 [Parelusimicrobium proximum]
MFSSFSIVISEGRAPSGIAVVILGGKKDIFSSLATPWGHFIQYVHFYII